MATVSNSPMLVPPKSQEAVIQYYTSCVGLAEANYNIRSQLETIDRAYQREEDWTVETNRAKAAQRAGDPTKLQNLKVPVVKPLVESAVTYQTSVFLTGSPIFGVVSDPAYIDEALQMETVIEEQSLRGSWVSHLMKFFRDGFKYNLSAVEVDWARETTFAIETDLVWNKNQGRPKEVIWEGNVIRHMDLYNLFWDTRVNPIDIPQWGDFAGYTKFYTRVGLKKFIASLTDKIIANVVPAFESGIGPGGAKFYVPSINQNAFVNNNSAVNGRYAMNWMAWAGLTGADKRSIEYKDGYEVTTLYARILPKDFNLRVPAQDTAQVWKFIIVNHSVVIYAERMTNAHGLIPILFGQPYEDGMGYQTKSLADDVLPMQDLSSALANSWIASRRRAISDRLLYDPSRVAKEHIESPNPTARIPVKPSAYGKPLSEAVYPFPYRDDQAQVAMSEMQQVQQFAYTLSGQNQAKQGQFVKGNKTRHEFAEVMANSNGGDQKTSLLLEDQVFLPMKHILKINILQYQGGTSLFSRNKERAVSIDPVALRKAVVNFKVSDGLAPADKLMDTETHQVAMQVIGSSPQIGSGYNIAPMFSYIMKLKGADLKPFEKSPQQVAYEGAMNQWSQLAQLAISKGQEFKQPQPKPQDYGYDPAQQGSAAPAQAAPTEVATRVNNITNNITNAEQ